MRDRFKCWLIASCIGWQWVYFASVSLAETLQERSVWAYHKEWDKLNNLNFSFVRSPMPKLGPYDNIRLEIVCKNNKLQLVAETGGLITSQNREFGFEYQIDKNPPVLIKLRTFKDSKSRGYTEEQIERIVGEIISGQSIFVRINTIISTVLTADITLKGASEPIQQVLSDCGVVFGEKPVEKAYSLTEFEQDFSESSPEQQRKVLSQIKQIMSSIRTDHEP